MSDTTSITGSKLGITVAVLLGAVMAVLDISIVNVALTDIRTSFGVALDQIGWVSTSYMMANVIVIPMTGWLQRRFGVRRYFVMSLGVFTVASVLCGLSWDFPSLVAFRVLQGIGGGAIVPTAQLVLLARYPREEHAVAGALFGLAAITGPLLGPTVGGYVIEYASWSWIFLANVPVGIVAMLMANKFIEEPGLVITKERPDSVGFCLLVVGMGSLQYVLEEGNRHDWWESTTILVTAALSAVALVTFVVHELEVENPLVDLRVFRSRDYAAGTLINCIAGLALFSSAYMFSLYCGAVMRYRALDIGLVFLAAGAPQLAVMPVLGRLNPRQDLRPIIAVGLLFLVSSFWLNGLLTDAAGYGRLVAPQILRSVGLALVCVPITMLTLSVLPDRQRGNATGLFNLTRELGGSIGTAWMSTYLQNRTHLHLTHLSSAVNDGLPVVEEQSMHIESLLTQVGDPASAGVALLAGRLSMQSLTRAFNDCFSSMALAVGISLLLITLLSRPAASRAGG